MKKTLRILFLTFVFWPIFSQAASFSFVPNEVTATPGESFEVAIFLDNQNEAINALDGEIIFPADQLEFQGVKNVDSLVNFWLKRPTLDGPGRLRFTGVIPGGFSGLLSPYYTGSRAGRIFSLVFRAPKPGSTTLDWQNVQALINDGEGSAAKVSTLPLKISIQSGQRNSAPVSQLASDTDPPEFFVPEISRDPNLFDNQWFLVFIARDTGSGLARYQVAEYTTPLPPKDSWREATSPYLLQDQSLKSYISVRAIDHSGNERTVTLPPKVASIGYANSSLWLIIILLCIALFCCYWFYSRRHS